MKNLKKILGIMLSLVLLLAACGNGGTADSDKVLYVATEKTFSTLNPQDSNVAAEKEVMGQYLEGLYGYDNDGALTPLDAESYEVSADGLVYTFKLRPNLEWANGDKLTANDYVFGWRELMANPKAAFKTQGNMIVNAPEVMKGTIAKEELGVKAIDDTTFEVTLTRPYPAFIHMITGSTFYPLHPATHAATGMEDYGTAPDKVMANGPYVLESYEVGSKIILKKNPKYWDAANVKIETVDISVVPELTTQGAMFDKGELDFIRVQGELADVYMGTENIIQHQENRLLYMYLSPTMEGTPEVLKNKNFRKAISMAIDKTVITENIMKDGAIPHNSLFPRGFMPVDGKDYRDISGKHENSLFDVEKAKEYLELAKKELGTETITFDFAFQDLVQFKKIFENIKSQVEANLPGVTMNLNSMPNQIYFPTLLEYRTPAAMVTWSASFVDYHNFTNQFHSKSTYDLSRYVNPEFDALVDKGNVEMNPEKQAEYFAQAEDILMEDAVFIPIYQSGASYKINPNLQNFSIRNASPTMAYKYFDKK